MPSASASTRGRPRASTPMAMRTPSTIIATWSEVLNDIVPVEEDLSSTPTTTITTTTTAAVAAHARRSRRGTAVTAAGGASGGGAGRGGGRGGGWGGGGHDSAVPAALDPGPPAVLLSALGYRSN